MRSRSQGPLLTGIGYTPWGYKMSNSREAAGLYQEYLWSCPASLAILFVFAEPPCPPSLVWDTLCGFLGWKLCEGRVTPGLCYTTECCVTGISSSEHGLWKLPEFKSCACSLGACAAVVGDLATLGLWFPICKIRIIRPASWVVMRIKGLNSVSFSEFTVNNIFLFSQPSTGSGGEPGKHLLGTWHALGI